MNEAIEEVRKAVETFSNTLLDEEVVPCGRLRAIILVLQLAESRFPASVVSANIAADLSFKSCFVSSVYSLASSDVDR